MPTPQKGECSGFTTGAGDVAAVANFITSKAGYRKDRAIFFSSLRRFQKSDCIGEKPARVRFFKLRDGAGKNADRSGNPQCSTTPTD
jgi:hypothetical protein